MKPYSFRLVKILEYRSYMRKKAQIEVSNARNECLKRETEVMSLVNKKKEFSIKCSEEEIIGISVPAYNTYQTYLKNIEYNLEKARIKLDEGKEEVMAKEAILKQASINKKTLEVLNEMKYKKYLEALGREEQKTLDELVITGKRQNA